jgi:hypothetical protein
MKYILFFLLGVLLSGAGVFLFMKDRGAPAAVGSTRPSAELLQEPVERRLAEIAEDLQGRLGAFAREVQNDQLFSLRLIVENYPSAPEVVNKAVQFLKPMGFSLLEIADSSFTIISCGHFPASTGNSIAAKMERLSDRPVVIADRMMGKEVITFQARHTFRIAESMVFHVAGGFVVDDKWLEGLSPLKDVRVIFTQGTVVLGMDNVKTISGVQDHSIIINDRKYKAAELPLSVADGEAPASLVVIAGPGGA